MISISFFWNSVVFIDTVIAPLHCKEDPIYLFPEIKLRGLVPGFHIHTSVSDLYFLRIGPPVLLQPNRQTDPGNI